MIEIRPNCVQNIKQNLSKQKFGIMNNAQAQPTGCPVFKKVTDKKEIGDVLKFFLSSFNHSAGNAGMSGMKNKFTKFYENFSQKTWAFIEKYRLLLSDSVVEVVKKDDKILGCYSLSFNEKDAYINFFAVNPSIKDSKMTVKTLLNMASRISEKAKEKKLDVISWTTDRKNLKAYRLFDKFPATKKDSACTDVDFCVDISDFDATLNRYL